MSRTSALSTIPKLAMGVRERAELLESTKWLHDLEFKQVERLSSYLESYVIKAGTVLVREGSNESYMGIIVKGEVTVTKSDSSGNKKKISVIGAGKAFGEMSLLDDLPRSADVEVTQTLTLLVLTKNQFQSLVQEAAPLATAVLIKLARLLSARLRQTSGKLAEFMA